MANDEAAIRAQFDSMRRQIAARLRELDSDVSFWRPRAFWGHISIAALGAAITVIAGLKVQGPVSAAWVPAVFATRENWILVFGAAITIISAWQAFYNHRDRWLNYAACSERLRALQGRVEFESKGSASGEKAQKLFDEFASILAELNRIEAAGLNKGKQEEPPNNTVTPGA